MKIIFFGTPEIAASILADILKEKGIEVLAIVTKIDKPQGRSQKILPSAVKKFAEKHFPAIPILQPKKVSSPEWEEKLKAFNADLFVVVAYGEILKQHILDIPHLGCINVHASLLPKYRGAAPMHRAIMNGETETGVTIMEMVLALDAGAILDSEKIHIKPDMTVGQLHELMAQKGSLALLRTLKNFASKKKNKIEQCDSKATYAAKITSAECEIEWAGKTKNIYDKIRGVSPYPGAWCYFKIGEERKRVRLLSVLPVYEINHRSAGDIIEYSKNLFKIATLDGAILIKELQMEGKKRMPLNEFFNGYPLLFSK